MQNHLSINAASEMLERTRRTVKRALRHVEPDSTERGQPRWRLPKIIAALESTGAPMNQPRRVEDGLHNQCDALFAQFDTAFDNMQSLQTLGLRRAAAPKVYGLIAEAVSAMRARDIADGLHEDHVSLRADRVFLLMMIGFEAPCAWSRDQVWQNLLAEDEPDV